MGRFIAVTPIMWKSPTERKLGNPFLINVDRIESVQTRLDGMNKEYSVIQIIGSRNEPLHVAEPYEDLVTAIADANQAPRRR